MISYTRLILFRMNFGERPEYAIPKMVEPEDIAAATAFLLSSEARFITGTTLPVDAGALARMPNAKV